MLINYQCWCLINYQSIIKIRKIEQWRKIIFHSLQIGNSHYVIIHRFVINHTMTNIISTDKVVSREKLFFYHQLLMLLIMKYVCYCMCNMLLLLLMSRFIIREIYRKVKRDKRISLSLSLSLSQCWSLLYIKCSIPYKWKFSIRLKIIIIIQLFQWY